MNKLNAPIRGVDIITKLIPHRDPMIMIDALVYHDEKSSISELLIMENNIFLKNSKFLESGILEHMAQTAAIHIGYKSGSSGIKPRHGYIAAIHSAEFYYTPKVSELLVSNLNILFESQDMSKLEISTYIEDKLIAVATMTTILKPKDK